jgi:DNA-binding Lrp family transcriptional regulator
MRMVTAFVMMQVERGRVSEIAEKLADMEGVREVHSVTGEYDLVAIVWVKDNDMLADVVTGRLCIASVGNGQPDGVT